MSTPVALHHELSGPPGAPVLVLGNSLGTTMDMWDPQLAALRQRFQVLRFDTRGHGGSPVPAGDYTLDDLGHDVLGLLDSIGADRVHYCGLSLGGMVGMWLGTHAPERIDRLALCCTAAHFSDKQMWADRQAQVRATGTASIMDGTRERWFSGVFRDRDPETVRRVIAGMAATPSDGYAGCCAAISGMDLRPVLPRISAPTLVIAGGADPATPPAEGSAIAAAIPGARLVVIPGVAHLANIEAPGQVSAALLEHFTGGRASDG